MQENVKCEVPVSDGYELSKSTQDVTGEFTVYKKRWFILAVFWFIAAATMMQFMTYSIVADVLVTYYDITYPIAGWTSMVCMVTYLTLMIPGSYMLDVCGIRVCGITTMVFVCVGAWIKVGSVDPSRYWVLLLGQGVAGAVQSIAGALPIKIAAVWFPGKEVSTANGIGLIGVQVGFVVGMFLPPIIVQQGTIAKIQDGLYLMAYVTAGFSTLVLIMLLFFFPNAPPNAPSYAQYNATKTERSTADFLKTLSKLFYNLHFICLLLSVGLIFGVMFPMIINFNQLMMAHHPGAAQDIGYILYRITFIAVCILTSISGVLFLELIPYDLYVSYLTAIAFGVTSGSLNIVATELAVELTYPEPQSAGATLVYAFCQISGICLTYGHSALLSYISQFRANMLLYITLIIGNLFVFGIKFDLKRKHVEDELKENRKAGTI